MIIDEQLDSAVKNVQMLQAQIEEIDRQILALQRRKEAIVVSFHRADGALSILALLKQEQTQPISDKELEA